MGGLVAAVVGESGLCAALAFIAIFLYALYSFIVSLSYYPTAYSVKQLMSSNMRIGLPSSMALNFKQAVKFAACRVSIAVPIDIALIILAVLLVWGLFTVVGVFAFPIVILLGIIVVSLRSAFFGGWLPRLLFVEGESMYTAFGRSLRAVKLNLKGLMKAFVITFFAAFALMAGLSVPTFGLVIVVIPSIDYFLFRTIELVGYYKMTGMSFYTDAANGRASRRKTPRNDDRHIMRFRMFFGWIKTALIALITLAGAAIIVLDAVMLSGVLPAFTTANTAVAATSLAAAAVIDVFAVLLLLCSRYELREDGIHARMAVFGE